MSGKKPRYGNKNFKKQKSAAPKESTKFECLVCSLTCDGAQQYNEHLNGQKHKKKEARFIALSADLQAQDWNSAENGSVRQSQDKPDAAVLPNNNFHCSLCNVSCTSIEPYQLHVSGLKHKKNMARTSGKVEPPVCSSENKSSEPSANETLEKAEPSFSGLLGSDFLKEELNDRGMVVFFKCELCSCKMTDANAAKSHLEGRKHRQNYKSKVDKEIEVGPKSAKRTKSLQKTKAEKEKARMEFWKKKDDFMSLRSENISSFLSDNGSFGEMKEWGRKSYSQTDLYIMNKHDLIEMDHSTLEALLWYVDCCEVALKQVSDEFLNSDIKKGDDKSADMKSTEGGDVEESNRVLKGTMRVGILFSGQIMKEDDLFKLVLLTSNKPTISLLERVHDSFPSHLRSTIDAKPDGEKVDFEIILFPEEASLVVQMLHPHSFRIVISITSPIVDELGGNEESVSNQDGSEMLNTDACLESLQQLRRSKWFQVRASHLSDGMKVMKVMRHLRIEDEVWSYLSEWANELLIEKCAFMQGKGAKPGFIMRSYLQVLASGFLLDGTGLLDPCEKEPTDLLSGMTKQQKEDLTAYAQKCLRLLAFRQIYKMLHVEQYVPKAVKRKQNENDGDEDSSIPKKPCLEEDSTEV